VSLSNLLSNQASNKRKEAILIALGNSFDVDQEQAIAEAIDAAVKALVEQLRPVLDRKLEKDRLRRS